MVAISATLPVPEGCSFGAIRTPIPRIGGDNLRFGRSRSSWIVRTESNVRKEKIRKPDPPCMVCAGSGRVNCRQCEGRDASLSHCHPFSLRGTPFNEVVILEIFD
ncbi:hypothetical protein HPP92_007269 [Vanilla planifolia]|uniref:Uncharacterized protein n=1 Tax=Vanilla planifolia TaxID=51239 RepID=A0A835RDJ2_VANPL|nr:hypothetical protein HPP92_007269 [Vanilla planifolia]